PFDRAEKTYFLKDMTTKVLNDEIVIRSFEQCAERTRACDFRLWVAAEVVTNNEFFAIERCEGLIVAPCGVPISDHSRHSFSDVECRRWLRDHAPPPGFARDQTRSSHRTVDWTHDEDEDRGRGRT